MIKSVQEIMVLCDLIKHLKCLQMSYITSTEEFVLFNTCFLYCNLLCFIGHLNVVKLDQFSLVFMCSMTLIMEGRTVGVLKELHKILSFQPKRKASFLSTRLPRLI